MTGYAFAYDPELWIEVPVDFDGREWNTGEEWARDIAQQIAVGAPDPDEAREIFYQTAREIVDLDLPGASDRFWYFPLDAEFVTVAHSFVVPRELIGDEATLEQFAGVDEDSITVPSIEEIESATFGRVVLGLITKPAEVDGERAVTGYARLVGERDGLIFMLEVADQKLGRIALVLDDLVALLETVRFSDDETPAPRP